MDKEMLEETEIAGRVAEAVGHDGSGQPIDQAGTEGLVAALPFLGGMGEEGCITHECVIAYGGYKVNQNTHKTLHPQQDASFNGTASMKQRLDGRPIAACWRTRSYTGVKLMAGLISTEGHAYPSYELTRTLPDTDANVAKNQYYQRVPCKGEYLRLDIVFG
jgi:hypothetical protein